MKVIGLTGGIASGKTTVADILSRLGAAVIDADILAREAVMPGTPGFAAVVEAFGEEILAADGALDRKKLGQRVFADADARRLLERLTHPAIGRLAKEKLAAHRQAGAKVAFYVAPLLIEAGIRSRVDEVWVVYVDRETQVRRLTAREGLSPDEAFRRIESQMPMEEKVRHGRFVIDNRGTVHETEREVRKLWDLTVRETEK